MSQTIQIDEGQTLIDAAVQHLGDASLAVQSALNNDISVTDDISSAVLDDADVSAQKTVTQMNKPYNIPASKDNEAQGVGIGYWGLGTTFKIG